MRSTSGSSSSQCATWPAQAVARPPAARISAATRSHASPLRLTTTTCAPAPAKAPAIASPRPRVPPVTTATRSLRSNRDRASRDGCDIGPLGRSGVAEREAPAPVLAVDLAHEAGGVQELEVSEHLPDDEQRLLAHGPLRPQVPGDPVGGGGSVQQHARDARGAPAVLRLPQIHEGGG